MAAMDEIFGAWNTVSVVTGGDILSSRSPRTGQKNKFVEREAYFFPLHQNVPF